MEIKIDSYIFNTDLILNYLINFEILNIKTLSKLK